MCSPWSRLKPEQRGRPATPGGNKSGWGFLAALVFLAGCSTAPPPVRLPGEAAAWLGGSPRAVVRLDALQVRAWGQVTGANDALKAVGDRTRTVWLGFDLASLDDLRTAADTVRIVLEGDFPRGGAGLMLDWNSAWKKGAEKGAWTNAKLEMTVSLPADNLVAVRRRDPAPARPASGVLRDLDPKAVEASALWATFWDPGEALFGTVGAKVLPVRRADVVLAAAGEFLEGPVILHFADDRAARAASVLLKLFGPQIRSRLGQDLDWSVEGPVITGSTLRLKQDDLKALAQTLVADTVPQEAIH